MDDEFEWTVEECALNPKGASDRIEADTKVIEAARRMIEAWEQSPTGSHDCCATAAMEKALSAFNEALDAREKGKNDG